MKILLVEPDTQLGAIYAKALKLAGHEVAWQRDAQSAIQTSDEFTADLVVLELLLARHNGVEFLYEFRSYPDWQHIPIILHTNALELPASQNLLEQLGVKAVYYKPQTSLSQLVDAVEQLLTLQA